MGCELRATLLASDRIGRGKDYPGLAAECEGGIVDAKQRGTATLSLPKRRMAYGTAMRVGRCRSL